MTLTSNSMLNITDEIRHPSLVPESRGKASSFLSLSMLTKISHLKNLSYTVFLLYLLC